MSRTKVLRGLAAAAAMRGPHGTIATPGPHGISRGRGGSASGYDTGRLALPRLQPPSVPSNRRASPGVATSFIARGHCAGIRPAALLTGSWIEPLAQSSYQKLLITHYGQSVLASVEFLLIPSKPYYPLTLVGS